ncbi:carboxyl-terminal [Musa troglodytarum]|uniref:Carboxyl-terminal n=1 Tax=Musa troglodytarum TaxID=320322 RepID=A0A9E7JX50_9LILI|nr:carboxyl-terminal [Musa troglodytarum]
MASNGCRPSLSIHAIVSLVLLLLAAAATCLPASAENSPKQSNKPSLKTVQSPDGDIIDCVPSHLQPAFDHPKLKGLKPLEPPERPEGRKAKSMAGGTTQLWRASGETCPQGTVPIRRTTEEEALRVRKHERKLVEGAGESPNSNHEYAIGTVEDENLYYGAEATYNVWAPAVANDGEFSLSQFWLTSGTYPTSLNTIEAGWQVLYGNSYPRFFVYWTADAYQSTGCYDLTCPGFVQTNADVVVGGSISPTSTYDGEQSEMKLLDHKDGNWWLEWDSTVVGYWPSSLFSNLADSATSVQFGGEIVNKITSGVHTATQMGSGYFPEEGYGRAAYTRNLQVVDATNTLVQVQSLGLTAGRPNCYNITKGVNSDWGTHFFFGGPGRSDVCP